MVSVPIGDDLMQDEVDKSRVISGYDLVLYFAHVWGDYFVNALVCHDFNVYLSTKIADDAFKAWHERWGHRLSGENSCEEGEDG